MPWIRGMHMCSVDITKPTCIMLWLFVCFAAFKELSSFKFTPGGAVDLPLKFSFREEEQVTCQSWLMVL